MGWIVPDDEGFRPLDVLRRQVLTGLVDCLTAEETLEAHRIGFLADRYLLRLPDGRERPVRITADVSAHGVTVVTVVTDEYGSASVVRTFSDRFVLPSPAPKGLRAAPG